MQAWLGSWFGPYAHLGGRPISAGEKHPDTPEQLSELTRGFFREARELDSDRFLRLLAVGWKLETFGKGREEWGDGSVVGRGETQYRTKSCDRSIHDAASRRHPAQPPSICQLRAWKAVISPT
jgi:hypothetical protein